MQVAASSGCNLFEPWAAFVSGLFAGGCYILVAFLVRIAQIDDPVEAVGGASSLYTSSNYL